MKFRSGFVSNSSSSSFVLVIDSSVDRSKLPDVVQEKLKNDNRCVEELSSWLRYLSEDTIQRLSRSTQSERALSLLQELQNVSESHVIAKMRKHEGETQYSSECENFFTTVISTLVAKMIVEFEACAEIEVAVLSFASDEGDDEACEIRNNGLPEITGVASFYLTEG